MSEDRTGYTVLRNTMDLVTIARYPDTFPWARFDSLEEARSYAKVDYPRQWSIWLLVNNRPQWKLEDVE